MFIVRIHQRYSQTDGQRTIAVTKRALRIKIRAEAILAAFRGCGRHLIAFERQDIGDVRGRLIDCPQAPSRPTAAQDEICI